MKTVFFTVVMSLWTSLWTSAWATSSCPQSTSGQQSLCDIAELHDQLWMTQAFDRTARECPDRIWPNLNMGDKGFRIIDPKGTSYEITSDGKAFSSRTIDNTSLKENPAISMAYAFTQERGCMITNVQFGAIPAGGHAANLENTFGLAFHESFHKYTQSTWPPSFNASRHVKYPESIDLIYARQMEIESLKKALTRPSERKNFLCSAKSWHEKVTREFPDRIAAIRYYDITEGTAMYAEVRAVQIAKNKDGCLATNDQLDATTPPSDSPIIAYQLDSQSYPLGGYSGLLLDTLDPAGHWKPEVAAGSTPTEVLFKKVSECPHKKATDDDTIRKQVKSAVDQMNQEAAGDLLTLLEQWNSKSYTRLAIAGDTQSGSIELENFYDFNQLQDMTVLRQAKMVLKSEKSQIQLKNVNALEKTGLSPCGGSFDIIALVPGTSIALTGNQLNIETDQVSTLSLDYSKKTDVDGYTWVCAR